MMIRTAPPACSRLLGLQPAAEGTLPATVNLIPGDEIAADDEGESDRGCCVASIAARSAVPRWMPYLLDEKTQAAYLRQTHCPGYEIEEGQYRIKGYEGPSLECDKCGSEMQLKTGLSASSSVAPIRPARTPASC